MRFMFASSGSIAIPVRIARFPAWRTLVNARRERGFSINTAGPIGTMRGRGRFAASNW
jgi:hypothetical protein